MDIHFCPNCDSDLEDQYGYDSSFDTWTCTECGQFLMNPDLSDADGYSDTAWFCDNCNALLNRQIGFANAYETWTCTECGYTNGITEDDIWEDEHKCPDCDANLKNNGDIVKILTIIHVLSAGRFFIEITVVIDFRL